MASKPYPELRRYDGIDNFRPFAALGVIILHLSLSTGTRPQLEHLVRLRDCALPFFVMTSFFLLTRALMRGSGKSYGEFLKKRFVRIGIPFLVWTALYVLAFDVLMPLRHGEAAVLPGPSILVTGYGHLWFLSFALLSAALLYPLARALAGRQSQGWGAVAGCFAFPVLWAVAIEPTLARYLNSAEAGGLAPRMMSYLDSLSTFLPYAPLGMGLGLIADRLSGAFAYPAVRVGAIVLAVAAGYVHIQVMALPITRMFFSVGVFTAALQPWPVSLTLLLRPVAARSYSIYITFKFVVFAFITVIGRMGMTVRPEWVPAVALVVLAVTYVTVSAIQTLLPWAWLLPPNEVGPAPAAPEARPQSRADRIWATQPETVCT